MAAVIDSPKEITKKQLQYLIQFFEYRNSETSLYKFISRNIARWVFLFLMVGVAVGTALIWDCPTIAVFFAAMGVGAFIRDFGWYRNSAKIWNLQRQFIDWEKLEAFLKEKGALKE